MRILHVVQLYDPVASGAARYFREIGLRLVAEGHEVTVLATDAHDLEHLWAPGKRRVELAHEVRQGIRVERLPVERIAGPPVIYPIIRRLMVEISRLPGTTPLLRRMAQITPRLPDLDPWLQQQPGFDLVHGTNITLDFALWPVFAYAQQRQIPWMMTPFVHLGPPGDTQIVRYYSMRHQIDLLRWSDRVITMTAPESQFLISRGVSAERIRQVGVGVTPQEVLGGDRERFRAEQQLDGPMVLYIGVLARDKGAIDTVEALRRLWDQGQVVHLVMIGAPMEHFTQYLAQLPAEVRQRVRLLPYATDALKRDALAAADMLVLPSRTDSFGIVFLEAWCYRLPVIGALAGGIPGVIDHETNGLLIPYGNSVQLAAAIQRLLADPVLAASLGRAGWQKVQQRYTWDQVYQSAKQVYQELCAGLG